MWTLAEAAGDERADDRSRSTRVVALDPFDATAHTGWGRLALESKRRRRRDARVPRGASRPARPTRPRRTATSAKAICSRPTGRRQEGSARGARDRAELRARAGAAAQRGREEVDDSWRWLRVSCCSGQPLWPLLTCLRRSAPQRRRARAAAAGARRARRALRRPAVDVRPHPLHGVDDAAPRRAISMYDEPWYIDAPAADWNLSRRVRTRDRHPGQRSDRPSRSRIRSSSTIRGSTSSRAATCG